MTDHEEELAKALRLAVSHHDALLAVMDSRAKPGDDKMLQEQRSCLFRLRSALSAYDAHIAQCLQADLEDAQ